MANGPDDRLTDRDKVTEAKAKGYEGFACEECGSFTIIPYGTGFKCDTCGNTTGDAPTEDADGIPLFVQDGC